MLDNQKRTISDVEDQIGHLESQIQSESEARSAQTECGQDREKLLAELKEEQMKQNSLSS